MEFENILNSVKKAAKKAVKVTVKTSTEVVDYGKCKMKIISLNDKIAENYQIIGEMVFNSNLYDKEIDNDKLEKICNEIISNKEEIKTLEDTIKKEKAPDDKPLEASNKEEKVTEEDFQ